MKHQILTNQAITNLTRELKARHAVEIQKWLITADGIKRQYRLADGTRSYQRLPKSWYISLDEIGRKDLLNRLNAEDWRIKKALDAYEIQSAFIPPNVLSEFERKLARDSKPQTATARMQNLKKYCLEFFLPKSPNPIEWQRDLQGEWVDYLVDLDMAPSTYKHIRTALNKFMRFLATKKPDLPVLQFDGLSPFQVAEIRFAREAKGLGVRRYIPEHEYALIYEAAPSKLKPYVAVAYGYGLRRNELRALSPSAIKNKYLLVDKQLTDDGTTTLPKYRKIRKVPHWMMGPKDLHTHISKLEKYLDGPSLSEAFTEVTKTLHLVGEIAHQYVLHDCRHSFVSNAADSKDIHDVMFAAGHADLRTTSTYLKDKRVADDETYDPTGS